MANGHPLDDNALTAAMWDMPFGTLIKVTNLENNKSIVVKITDRGPAKRLVKKGRIIDLSKKSFGVLTNNNFNLGIINVKIENGQSESYNKRKKLRG